MGVESRLLVAEQNIAGLGRRVRALEEARGSTRESEPDSQFATLCERFEERLRRLEGAPVRRRLTIREVAERLGVSTDTVLRDSKLGRLRVINMRPPGMKPKYRVTEEAFDEYAKGLSESSTPHRSTQD